MTSMFVYPVGRRTGRFVCYEFKAICFENMFPLADERLGGWRSFYGCLNQAAPCLWSSHAGHYKTETPSQCTVISLWFSTTETQRRDPTV